MIEWLNNLSFWDWMFMLLVALALVAWDYVKHEEAHHG